MARGQNEKAARTIQAAERRRAAKKEYNARLGKTATQKGEWGLEWFDESDGEPNFGSWGASQKYELPVAKEIDCASRTIPTMSIEHEASLPTDEFFESRSFPIIDQMIEGSRAAVPMFAVKQEVTTTYYPAASVGVGVHMLPPPSQGPPEDLPPPPAFLLGNIRGVEIVENNFCLW